MRSQSGGTMCPAGADVLSVNGTGAFRGRVALVTGGGVGIGRAIVQAYIAAGGRAIIAGRRLEPLAMLQAAYPQQVDIIQADMGRSGEARRLADFVERSCGRLDTLVNNAGVWLHRPLAQTTDEDLQKLTAVNVTGVLSLIRECLPLLQASAGSVVNISSVGARAINVGTAAYGGTKAAINQITRLLAAELGLVGIRVNAVAPGFTATEMSEDVRNNPAAVKKITRQTILGRFGEPHDIAPVVLMLASDAGGWVTGQVIEVSGGFML